MSLIGILNGEIKRIRAGSSEYPKAIAAADYEARPIDKLKGSPVANPDDLPSEESVQGSPSS